MVPEAQTNVTFALQEPLLLTLAPINAPSALLVLLKTTEPNVFPALLVPTPSKLLKLPMNAMPAPLVPLVKLLAQLLALDVPLVLSKTTEPNVFPVLLVLIRLMDLKISMNAIPALQEPSPRPKELPLVPSALLATMNWTDCPAKLAPLVLSSLLEARMLLNVNLVLMVMSPETMAHLRVISVHLVPTPALVKLLATIVPSELSLLMVEPTTVLFAQQDLLPKLKALTPAQIALLALMNKIEPLVTTALLVPTLQLLVFLTSLIVRLAQLELSPETLDPLPAPSVLLVVMPSTELDATTAPLVLSLLKEPEISMTVLPALQEALPRELDQLLAPSAQGVILNSIEASAMLVLLVLLLLKDLSFPPTVLLVKKDGLPDPQELLNAASALMVLMN
jgi:hypothetical protein